MPRPHHAKGYAVYARNDQTPRHQAVKSWQDKNGVWYCACDYRLAAPADSARASAPPTPDTNRPA